MQRPKYQRLLKEDEKGGSVFVGFKRTVTQYLPAGGDMWQNQPIDYSPELTVNLAQPAMGIECLKRARIPKR